MHVSAEEDADQSRSKKINCILWLCKIFKVTARLCITWIGEYGEEELDESFDADLRIKFRLRIGSIDELMALMQTMTCWSSFHCFGWPINHLWVYANIFCQKDFLTRLNQPRILWLKRHSFQSLRPRCHHPLLLLDYSLLWLDFENQKLTWISIKSVDFLFPWRLCCCLPQKWSH